MKKGWGAVPVPYLFLLGSKSDVFPDAFVIEKPLSMETFEPAFFKHLSFPPKFRVLVVDDEHEVCEAIKEFFEFRKSPSFEVDYALNGLDGFKKMESFKPDVMILDLKMPIKNGFELFRESHRKNPDGRFIILSATVAAEEVTRIRDLGAAVVVEKGSQGSSFLELISLIKKMWVFS